MTLHPQADLMRSLIEQQEVRSLYHFTDIDNLPLIASLDGLRSKAFLEQHGHLESLKTGGNDLSRDLDIHWGNWDKVSLSWCSKLPMAYWREQQQHLCYIIVEREYALQQGVIFTDRNAVDNNHHRNEGLAGLQAVDFQAVKREHPYPNPEIKKRKQAEVLVPNHVPLSAIRYVVFRSESSRQEAERICLGDNAFRARFQVAGRLFHLPSSYVKTHVLTTDAVTRVNVSQGLLTYRDIFYKTGEQQNITLALSVYGVNGASRSIRFIHEDGQIVYEATEQFSQTANFWTWSSIGLDAFESGQYRVDFYLSGNTGEIRQLSIPFSVVS